MRVAAVLVEPPLSRADTAFFLRALPVRSIPTRSYV